MRGSLMLLVFAAALISALVGGCPPPTPPDTLTITLDPSLNSDGDIKATTINMAELLDSNLALIESASIVTGSAVFDLTNVAAGAYSIRINTLDDDLVPTQIDDPTTSAIQTVGTTLRPSVIGPLSDPSYRIDTFSAGQAEQPVVKYSDGTAVAPTQYAYVLFSLKTSPQRLSIRILGTNNEIDQFSSGLSFHPGGESFTQPLGTWLLNLQSPLHHGDAFGGNDASCNTCHGDLDSKPPIFSNASVSSGWCFRCHYGKGGSGNGFVAPTR